jgi:hypothetical protein
VARLGLQPGENRPEEMIMCDSRISTRRALGIAALAVLVCSICMNRAPALAGALQEHAGREAGGAESTVQDAEFARLVKEWTTRPEFLSPLVDHLPVAAGVPSPKDILGHHIGEPRRLTYYARIVDYYRSLASKTPGVKVIDIGRTDEGRELVVVAISSEESIRNLEQYRARLASLADPRGVSEAEAQAIITLAKPIYHLIGGLHSGETGAPEMLMELAYRLAVEDSPLIRRIRDNVIVTITPVAEPDGHDRFVDWYYRYLVDITDERDNLPGPPFWGKYVYHDNNRDINFSQVITQALLNWYLEWHPPIIHDLHESVPFLYTFSGQAPQNPTLDPILFGELPWFANFEMAQMTQYGMPGVWTHAFVDAWSPGYLGFMASNHNGMLRMYETFGNEGATTMKRKVDRESEPSRSMTSRQWYRPLPPYKEVEWSMRNNTNYMQTGVLSALDLTASFPKVILENFYRKSLNAVAAGRKGPPFGYVIPAGQKDMTRVAFLVGVLRTQGIEVGQADAEVKMKEGSFPAGSFIVKLDQPYGRLAKILLEKQEYPDANLRTYDDTGWTMGLMTHTEVHEISDSSILDLQVKRATGEIIPGAIQGEKPACGYAVLHDGSNSMVTLRTRLAGVAVKTTEKSFKAGDSVIPAGSFIVPAAAPPDTLGRVRKAVIDLGLRAVALQSEPEVRMHEADLPRVAVYSTWGSTQDVGWVRYALDRLEMPYELIYKERVRQGHLRKDFDVILIPNQAGSAKELVFDVEPGARPMAYTRSGEFPSLGMYGESEDISGGMGLEGALEFRKFVEEGGLLITLCSASTFPIEFGLIRTVDTRRPSPQFYAPGPVVEAEILRPEHPIFYGYQSTTVPVRYAGGPLFQIPEKHRERLVLMRFTGTDKSVLSGLMKNPSDIKEKPAILDVPAGKGRVIMFATNPCYRWQNHGEFNMLFNAILNYNDFPER